VDIRFLETPRRHPSRSAHANLGRPSEADRGRASDARPKVTLDPLKRLCAKPYSAAAVDVGTLTGRADPRAVLQDIARWTIRANTVTTHPRIPGQACARAGTCSPAIIGGRRGATRREALCRQKSEAEDHRRKTQPIHSVTSFNPSFGRYLTALKVLLQQRFTVSASASLGHR
jgi:hypothetical protein